MPAGPGAVRERTDTRTPSGGPVALVSVVLEAGPWVIARTDDARPGDTVALIAGDDGVVQARRA